MKARQIFLANGALFAGVSMASVIQDRQTAPPPPPEPKSPVCGYENYDGSTNKGVDQGDAIYEASILQGKDQCGSQDGSAGKCHRMRCTNTTGFWLCNNVDTGSQPCDVVGAMVSNVLLECNGWAETEGASGYQDSSGGDYRVYVGHANCDDYDDYASPLRQ